MIKDYRILGVLFVIVAGLTAASIAKLMKPEYAQFQEMYYQKSGVTDFKVEIQQVNVQTPSGVLIDRCTTCHMGHSNAQAADYPEPLKLHPPIVPGVETDPHDLNKMGCVVCHDGNGRGLKRADAHGDIPFWIAPLMTGKDAQANCSKCHAVDKDLAGADMLNHGRKLFIEKECWACHRIEGVSEGTKGPDLSDAGNKFSMEYLRESIENPKANIESSTMPKFDWVDSNPEDVDALVVYLKAQRQKKLRSADKAPVEFKPVKAVWQPLNKGASAEFGKEIFHAKSGKETIRGGCVNCHSYKTEAPVWKDGKLEQKLVGGNIGPELTYAFKSRGPEFIKAHIKDPSVHVPDSNMPKFNTLSDTEIESLVLFLQTMDTKVEPRKPEVLYAAMCANCHGEDFDGQGRVNSQNKLLDPHPRNFRHQFIMAYKDRLPMSIKKGVKGTDMPSWETLLSDEEITALINYIEAETAKQDEQKAYVRPKVSLPKVGEKDPVTGTPIVAGNADVGKVYFQKNCTGCHGKLANGKGPNAYQLEFEGKPIFPRNLISQEFMGKNGITDERLFQSILLGVPGTPMPTFDRQLTHQQILDVIAYLRLISKPESVKQEVSEKAPDAETRSRQRLQLPKVGDKDRLTGETIGAADLANGRSKFMRSCVICHTQRGGEPGSEPKINWSTLLKDGKTDEDFYRAVLKGVPGTFMQEYSRKLSDQDVLDIMAYLKDLKKKETE